jgi:surface antigen
MFGGMPNMARHQVIRSAGRLTSIVLAVGLAVSALTMTTALSPNASADSPVTYTATKTIPVPPASTYAGSGGGDGWAVAMTPTAVYNVFHHATILQVACHLQSDASACWDPKTVTDQSGNNFATSGQPGLWIDQNSGKLYVYATRTSDSTGGVVCIDTTQPADVGNPFCGFTALSAPGDSPVSWMSALSTPAIVGSKWYAFNYAPGDGVSGTKNKLLCFDLTTLSACSSQPYTVNIGTDPVSGSASPSPAVAAIGDRVIVPINAGGTDRLGCFDATAQGDCTGAWPVQLGFSYASANGAPFPLTDSAGNITGFCLPTGADPCYDLSGASTNTPAGLTGAISASNQWNGPALLLGPRVYVPNGDANVVQCFDYSTSSACSNFPKSFDNLGYLYTVNADPQRPECIWVNADNGTGQIQNFDAYSGAACGQGPIRVLASSIVVPTQVCTPTTYTSLQVTEPAAGTYSSGSVQFLDGAGNPITGIADRALDSTGTAGLTGLNLNTATGLPQFLITLLGASGAPGSVTVKLTWTGTNDPSCIKPGTEVTTNAGLQFVSPTPAEGALIAVKRRKTVVIDFAASDPTAPGRVSMQAVTRPSGASFSARRGNPSMGRLRWTPRRAGNYLVTVRARDRVSPAVMRTLTIIVFRGSQPPTTPIPGTTTGTPYAIGGGRGAAGGWPVPPRPRPAAGCPAMQVTSLQDAGGIPLNYHGPLFVDAAPVTGCIAAARSLAGYANVGGATNQAHQWGVMGRHPWGVSLVQNFRGGRFGRSIIMQGCSSEISWDGRCLTPSLAAYVVRGGIWNAYRTHGGIDTLGPPLGNELASRDGGAFQLFAGGMIVWSPQRGGRIVVNRSPNDGGTEMKRFGCDQPWTSRGYAGRNCTDYVAWRLETDGHRIPGGMGDATQWPASFRNRLRPAWVEDHTPRPGDAAVQYARGGSRYGHVAYVRAVNADGTLSIEDFNRHPRCGYSITERVNPENFDIFLHPPANSWQ